MEFRNALLAVTSVLGVGHNLYEVMDLADLMVAEYNRGKAAGPATPTIQKVDISHERLVEIALDSRSVQDALFNSQKINAIKALKNLTGAGLKESKEAVEDHRVMAHYNSPF